MYRGCLFDKYPTEVLRRVRYGLNTLPDTPVRFGTNSSGKVRYALDTGARHFGKFGTTSIPIPDTSVSSVRSSIIPRVLVWCTLPNIPFNIEYCSADPFASLRICLGPGASYRGGQASGKNGGAQQPQLGDETHSGR